jgi:hypothetical protein
VGLHADRGQCCLLLNTYTFAGWVAGSMYHNVSGMFSWSLADHKYDFCLDETWMLNSQGSLSCSPWKSVCHDWTATDGTHNCMPGCDNILPVTTGWLISMYGFCLCGIRSWKSRIWWFLGMKGLLNVVQSCWVGSTEPVPWPGRSDDFTPRDIFWNNVTESFIFKC